MIALIALVMVLPPSRVRMLVIPTDQIFNALPVHIVPFRRPTRRLFLTCRSRGQGFAIKFRIGMTAWPGLDEQRVVPCPGTSRRRVGALAVRWIGLTACQLGGSNSSTRIAGFIAPAGGGSDVFVHVHDVEAAGMKTLVADQLVAYEVGPARDGRTKAVNLRSLSSER